MLASFPGFFFFFPFLVPCTVGNNPFSSSSKEGGKKEVGDLEVDVDRGETVHSCGGRSNEQARRANRHGCTAERLLAKCLHQCLKHACHKYRSFCGLEDMWVMCWHTYFLNFLIGVQLKTSQDWLSWRKDKWFFLNLKASGHPMCLWWAGLGDESKIQRDEQVETKRKWASKRKRPLEPHRSHVLSWIITLLMTDQKPYKYMLIKFVTYQKVST